MNGGNFLGRLQGLYGLPESVVSGLAGASGSPMPVDPSWQQQAPVTVPPAGPPAPPIDMGNAHGPPPADPNAPTALFARPMGDIAPAQGAALAQDMAAKGQLAAAGQPPGNPMEQGPSPQGAAAPYIPGHMQVSSRETSREGGLAEPFASGYAANRFAEAKDMNDATAQQFHNNQIMNRAMQETRAGIVSNELWQAHAQKQADNEALRQQYIKQNQDQVSQAAIDAGRQVDPEDIWKGNTFGRVLASLAIGLGQFGASLTHTENGALRIIEGAVRDNIDAQKTNIANAKGRLGDLRLQKLDKIAELDDDTNRHAALTVMYTDQVKQMAMDWALKNGLDPNGPQMKQIQAGMDRISADAYKDVGTVAGGKYTEKETQKYQAPQGGGTAMGSPVKREGNLVTTADGTTYHFGDDKNAQDAVKKLQGFGDVNLILANGLKLRNETMKLDPITDRTAFQANLQELQRLDDALGVADSIANGQGTVTAADTERRQKVGLTLTAGLGDDVTYAGLNLKGAAHLLGSSFDATNKVLENYSKSNDERQKAFVNTAGGEVYKKTYAHDKNGNVVPTGRYTGQDAQPPQQLTPSGARALDGKQHANVAGTPAAQTIPFAPMERSVYSGPTGTGKKGKE